MEIASMISVARWYVLRLILLKLQLLGGQQVVYSGTESSCNVFPEFQWVSHIPLACCRDCQCPSRTSIGFFINIRWRDLIVADLDDLEPAAFRMRDKSQVVDEPLRSFYIWHFWKKPTWVLPQLSPKKSSKQYLGTNKKSYTLLF